MEEEKTKQTSQKPTETLQRSEIDEEHFRRFKYTPEELEKKIEEYFEIGASIKEVIVGAGNNKTIKSLKIYTLTGMSLYCGFMDKDHLFQLERNNSYKRVIKKARARIEQIYEELLQTTGQSATIFALKNFGWVDKQEVIHEERTLKVDI